MTHADKWVPRAPPLRIWDFCCHSGRKSKIYHDHSSLQEHKRERRSRTISVSLLHSKFCRCLLGVNWFPKMQRSLANVSFFMPASSNKTIRGGTEWSGPKWNVCSTFLSCSWISSLRNFFHTTLEMTDGSQRVTLSR